MLCSLRMVFYAVRRGQKPGIYATWEQCSAQVTGFSGARFKKFSRRDEAERFMTAEEGCSNTAASSGRRRKLSSARAAPYPNTVSIDARRSHTQRSHREEAASTGRSATDLTVAPLENENIYDGDVDWPDYGLCDSEFDAVDFSAELSSDQPSSSDSALRSSKNTPGKHTSKRNGSGKRVQKSSQVTSSPPQPSGIPVCSSGDSALHVDSLGWLHVWTDGACSSNGRGAHARAGIGVYFAADHALNVSAPVDGPATNNNAELQAAWHALELAAAAGHQRVCVHTDSQFVINCATRWLPGWLRNGWLLSNGGPVKNRRQLEYLQRSMDGMTVKWVYVRGHSGDEGNECADRLACAGALKYKPRG